MADLFQTDVRCEAEISACGLYRYSLRRVWDDSLPLALWIMLNPSVADATQDDPTIRRVVGFARAWGRGGIVVTNLFAFRATDPEGLKLQDDPFGPANDSHVVDEAKACGLVVAAWGVGGGYRDAGRCMVETLRAHGVQLHCLGVTKDGHPRHPLYLPRGLKPIPFGAELIARKSLENKGDLQ